MALPGAVSALRERGLILLVNLVPEEGLEPSRSCEQRILSPSCLPFHHSGECEPTILCQLAILAFGTIRGVLPFIVGLVVGASVAAFLMILIGPSRKVRAEGALPPDVEAKLLLGQDPEQPTIPPPPRVDHDQPYTPNELAELQRLGDQRKRKKR